MTDELDTAPLPDPIPAPESVNVPEVAPAPASAAVPVYEPAAAPAPAPAAPPAAGVGKRNRVLGLTAQAAGVIGIVLFVALAVVMLLGRGWATSTVDDISAGFDAELARAVPLIDNASARVSEISGRVDALTDAANALASQAAAAPGLLGGLRDQVANLESRYLELKATYGDLRETTVTALGRVQVIDRLLPGFDIPQEVIDTLKAIDARLQELDARIMDVSAAVTDGPVQQVGGAVAERAALLQMQLAKGTAALDTAQVRLAELRAQIASTADTINMVISIGSILLFLLFLYFALLHYVLFHVGRGMRRAPAA
jgi:phage-related minor tail protein